MTTTYDAIFVGARCAGAPAAMLLARAGYRVLLTDRSTFPSDTISTHYIQPDGVAMLERWGLRERVLATGCPELSVSFTINGESLGPPPGVGGFAGMAPRRTVLDALLVDAAGEAGAEVRTGFSVRELVWEAGAVVGIRGQQSEGDPVEERARMVIGADGKSSMVARAVSAPEYNTHPNDTCGYYSYFSGMGTQADAVVGGGHMIFFFPTNDGLTCVGVEARRDNYAEYKADIEGYVRKVMATAPALAARYAAGNREERWYGMALPDGYYRKPFGPGWALVGDAGFFRDPVTGQGINDAFRDAQFLADALDAGFSGGRPLEEALADYQRQRDEASAMMYMVTNQLASLNPSPEFLAMLRQGPPAASGQPAAAAGGGAG